MIIGQALAAGVGKTKSTGAYLTLGTKGAGSKSRRPDTQNPCFSGHFFAVWVPWCGVTPPGASYPHRARVGSGMQESVATTRVRPRGNVTVNPSPGQYEAGNGFNQDGWVLVRWSHWGTAPTQAGVSPARRTGRSARVSPPSTTGVMSPFENGLTLQPRTRESPPRPSRLDRRLA